LKKPKFGSTTPNEPRHSPSSSNSRTATSSRRLAVRLSCVTAAMM
jgi:hypothetical protein